MLYCSLSKAIKKQSLLVFDLKSFRLTNVISQHIIKLHSMDSSLSDDQVILIYLDDFECQVEVDLIAQLTAT